VNKQKMLEGIDDNVCELMMDHGPDGRVDGHDIIAEMVLRRVLEERERCAKICSQKAEEWMKRADAGDMNRDTARHANIAAGQIEMAIRSQQT